MLGGPGTLQESGHWLGKCWAQGLCLWREGKGKQRQKNKLETFPLGERGMLTSPLSHSFSRQ